MMFLFATKRLRLIYYRTVLFMNSVPYIYLTYRNYDPVGLIDVFRFATWPKSP